MLQIENLDNTTNETLLFRSYVPKEQNDDTCIICQQPKSKFARICVDCACLTET